MLPLRRVSLHRKPFQVSAEFSGTPARLYVKDTPAGVSSMHCRRSLVGRLVGVKGISAGQDRRPARSSLGWCDAVFFDDGESAKGTGNQYLSRVGGQVSDRSMMLASDLRVLGDLECVINFQS
jgi:hypothetical protein